jgi:hypothetical protein
MIAVDQLAPHLQKGGLVHANCLVATPDWKTTRLQIHLDKPDLNKFHLLRVSQALSTKKAKSVRSEAPSEGIDGIQGDRL